MRALEDISPVDEYIELREQKARIEERLEELKAELTYATLEEPGGEFRYKGFKFSVYYRSSGFVYSDDCQKMEKNLKAAQKYERDTGVAEAKKTQAILKMEIDR